LRIFEIKRDIPDVSNKNRAEKTKNEKLLSHSKAFRFLRGLRDRYFAFGFTVSSFVSVFMTSRLTRFGGLYSGVGEVAGLTRGVWAVVVPVLQAELNAVKASKVTPINILIRCVLNINSFLKLLN
jgi:hypothetical protein